MAVDEGPFEVDDTTFPRMVMTLFDIYSLHSILYYKIYKNGPLRDTSFISRIELNSRPWLMDEYYDFFSPGFPDYRPQKPGRACGCYGLRLPKDFAVAPRPSPAISINPSPAPEPGVIRNI